MKTKYRKFKLILTTLAPVHIGSGEKYTAKEFIFEKEGSYYFPDMGRLYNYLAERKLDGPFEKFLLGRHNTSKRLADFLADKGLSLPDLGGYRLQATGFEHATETAGKLNDISKGIRDGFGHPYIPGSSLKGAIRTILLNTHWKNENFVLKQKYVEENKKIIPWGPKKDQPLDDIFHEIRVRDSKPLSNEDLILVQKWDYSPNKKTAKPLPVFKEAIAPLKRVEFEIITTTDRSYQLIKDLVKYAKEWGRLYSTFYADDNIPTNYRQADLQCPIYLGAGSGVWTKTIMEKADGYVQGRYRKMRTRMVGKGVVKLTKASMKRFKNANGDAVSLIKNKEHFYEMGKACFVLKEEE